MIIELSSGGIPIGSVVRGGPRVVYAYDTAGQPVGQFADIDAAASALVRLLQARAAA